MEPLDEQLRRGADDIQAAAARTPMPSLPPDTPAQGPIWTRITLVAAVAIVAIAALVVLSDRPTSDTAAPPPSQPVPIDRFIVDGMHVDLAIQWDDSRSSELWLNTPSDDKNSALPALSITTGEASFADVARWDTIDGRTVEVFGQRVPLHTINGDPLGIMWTTPSGVAVEIVGEGYSLEGFDDAVAQLRRMTEAEWSAIAERNHSEATTVTAPDTVGTLPAVQATLATSTASRGDCATAEGDGWKTRSIARAWLTSPDDLGCELRLVIECSNGNTYRGEWVPLEGVSYRYCPTQTRITTWNWETRNAQ